MTTLYTDQFVEKAELVGAKVSSYESLDAAMDYISNTVDGVTLVPQTPLASKFDLAKQLESKGVNVHSGSFREAGQVTGGGVTFCNFCMADSGTVVLDSTPEEIRLATTLPEKHFIIVDPVKILEDNLAAVPPMTELHQGSDPKFVAYITGPSRTADIERQLTIGCHGPREVHILLVENISDDIMEN